MKNTIYCNYTINSKRESDLGIRVSLAGTTLVNLLFISCLFNRHYKSSIGNDEEHTDKDKFLLHQFGAICGDFDKLLYSY